MIIKLEDTNDEVYHINPNNVVYIKERPSYGMWKIVFVTGEQLMTKNSQQVKDILAFLTQ